MAGCVTLVTPFCPAIPGPFFEKRTASMNPLFYLITIVTDIIFWVVLISVILSWLVAFKVINLDNPAMRRVYDFINGLTERMYRPIRKVIPTVYGGIDISPVIVLVILQVINYTLWWLSSRFGL